MEKGRRKDLRALFFFQIYFEEKRCRAEES